MDEQFDAKPIEIIWPTAQEVIKGYSQLQICWPTWEQTLGVLITSEGDRALVVSAIEYAHNNSGFVLRLAILEKLVAPSDFVQEECSLSCLWNQPYLSFTSDKISAPYDFYLHFEQAGVDRARELSKYMFNGMRESPGVRILRKCFGPNGAAYTERMLSILKDS